MAPIQSAILRAGSTSWVTKNETGPFPSRNSVTGEARSRSA